MKNTIFGKGLVLTITVMFFGSCVIPGVGGNNENRDLVQINNGDNLSAGVQNSYKENFNNKGNYFYSNPVKEKPSIEISEEVTILNDGTAELAIDLSVSSVSLVDLYKESFGISLYETNIDMEIPINTTRIIINELDGEITKRENIEPVREKFHEGIREEQKFLFGFQITDFSYSQIKSVKNDELNILIEASAVPYITDFCDLGSKTTYRINSAPEEVVNDFLYAQMDISRAMLKAMPNANMFEKTINLEIILPSDGEFISVDGRSGLHEFDGGTYICSEISQRSSKIIHYHEKWKVTDRHLSRRSIDVNRAFSLQYSLSSTEPSNYESKEFYFAHGDFRDDPWSWGFDWDIINLSGDEPVEYSILVNLYLEMQGYLHVDMGETEAWAEFSVDAGLEVDAEIHAAWEKTFPLDLGFFKGKIYDWRGMQPLGVVIIISFDAELYFSVEGYIHVWINPTAGFDLKAGGDADFVWGWPPVKFHTIFEFEPYCNLDWDFDIGAEVTIRPKLGFVIEILVFGIIGPRITPEIYFQGVLGYSWPEGIYWHAKLGFDLIVGLQFTPFLHWNWPDPLVDITLWEWDSVIDPEAWNPPDPDPPVTTHYLHPLVNGFPGWKTNFWYEAKDEGADASGLDVTKYNIPLYHGFDNWQEFDYGVLPILTQYPEYDLNFYSIDLEENVESTHTLTIYPELNPPESFLTVGESPKGDGVEIYAGQTPVTIEAQDDYTGYQIFYATWNETCGWSDMSNGSRNESVTHYFTIEDQGTCFIYWFTSDGAGNLENGQSEVFYVTTPEVILTNVKMCEYIGGPPVTEFDYGQECFCEIELDSAIEGDTVTWMWKLNDQIRYVDNTYVTSSTCWNSWTPDLAGEWTINIYYDYIYLGSSPVFSVIDGPEASLEYTIMCEYIGGPEVTEFDFGQECYSYCEFENIESGDIVKWKWIWGKDGQVKYTNEETITDPSIWCSWIPFFSGDWYVDIYYNDEYVGSGPTFIVKEPEFPKGIITEFTVYPNPVEYNGDFTASVTGKNIGNISGYFKIGLETTTHGVIMSEPTELNPDDTMQFQVIFEELTQSTYCNATLWWLSNYYNKDGNERDQILHDEEQIFVEVASQDIIGEINFTGSVFYTGPFHSEEKGRKVAMVKVKNIGIHTGDLHINLYEYPDSPDENLIFFEDVLVDPGVERICLIWIDISDGPEEGVWPFGLKVWGDTEPEPTWEIMNKTHQWNVEIVELHEPRITILEATNIKDTNVVLNAYCNDDGGEPCTCGFWYGTTYPLNETNSLNVTCDETVITGETCDDYINELTPGILYYAKSWISNLKGFFTSENTLSFHTISPDAFPPTVTINETTGINESDATLNGFLFDDGGEPSICGFWYGTTFPLNETNSQNVSCTGKYITGDSYSKIIDIYLGQTYYVCSWAFNSKGFFVSNTTFYENEFGDFSYTFDYSNINLGGDIPYTHSIEFPMSIWACNSSIANNDSVENFLNQGEIIDSLNCIFHQEGSKQEWKSWKKWRYENGLSNSLTNLEPLTNYYFYINNTDLPVIIYFEFDMYTPIPYDVIFPSGIWAFNSSIKQNDSCEKFCQQGGIWDDIDRIYHPDTGYFWKKGGSYNTLTNLTYGEHYIFQMLNKSEVSFIYDQGNYDNFNTEEENEPPNTPEIDGETEGNAGEEYEYTFYTTDPNEDDLSFYIEWGDDTHTDWTDYVASGTEVRIMHTWEEQGTYTIQAKAKDIHGAESEWGFLEIEMPLQFPYEDISHLMERSIQSL